jgi:hypothetical protein
MGYNGSRSTIGDPGNGTVAFQTNGATRFEADVNILQTYVPIAVTCNRYSADISQIYGNTNVTAEGASTGFAALAAGGAAEGTRVAVEVYGASHSSRPGAVSIKPEGIIRASNGVWTNVYSLAAGAHHGIIQIFDSIGGGYGEFLINGTTFAESAGWSNSTVIAYVNAGSAAAGNVALRVSGGFVQIKVGTAIAANTRFAIIFTGLVI